MVRWEPGTAQRLQAAALELFATRGYEQTTATDIAQAVGLTERTFFRHFNDKRDVLFDSQHLLLDAFLAGVKEAPPGASPLRVVANSLRSAARFFPDEKRPFSRTRQAVIDRNPALQERERHKLAGLAAEVAEALRARGIDPLAAALAAQTAATVFGISFAQWIRDDETRSLAAVTDEVLAALRDLNADR